MSKSAKKDTFLIIRMNAEEKEKLKSLAIKYKISMSNYVRKLTIE